MEANIIQKLKNGGLKFWHVRRDLHCHWQERVCMCVWEIVRDSHLNSGADHVHTWYSPTGPGSRGACVTPFHRSCSRCGSTGCCWCCPWSPATCPAIRWRFWRRCRVGPRPRGRARSASLILRRIFPCFFLDGAWGWSKEGELWDDCFVFLYWSVFVLVSEEGNRSFEFVAWMLNFHRESCGIVTWLYGFFPPSISKARQGKNR